MNEVLLRRGSSTVRPLCQRWNLSPQHYSRHLERLVVDFGAECSFAKAGKRVLLHHNLALSTSKIRAITLHHSHLIKEQQDVSGVHGALKGEGASRIITEMDGCMLPIVKCESTRGEDRRQRRDCHWREVRLCAAQEQGKSVTYYGVSLDSGAEQAGYTWSATVAKAGWGVSTELHAVGDGAAWIAQQCKRCLNSEYLLDLYHVCEYLSAAAEKAGTHRRWLEVQKNRLKTNHPERVIKALSPFKESEDLCDHEAPVRAALRYLENRLDQLDYQSAIEKDLPIGSGMIEGGHRHVLQARLKISGAWWKEENAASIASLRVARANEEESDYWEKAA